MLTQWSGADLLAARDATHWGHHESVFLVTGLMIGMVGMLMGRLELLAVMVLFVPQFWRK